MCRFFFFLRFSQINDKFLLSLTRKHGLSSIDLSDTFVHKKVMDNSSIKENVRRLRKKGNLTQEEMAHKLDISLTAYRDLEAGKTQMLNSKVMKMAELLNVPTEELVLGYTPQKNDNHALEEIKNEYGTAIAAFERRIADLEKIVSGLETIIESKNEIISMLKKRLGEEK